MISEYYHLLPVLPVLTVLTVFILNEDWPLNGKNSWGFHWCKILISFFYSVNYFFFHFTLVWRLKKVKTNKKQKEVFDNIGSFPSWEIQYEYYLLSYHKSCFVLWTDFYCQMYIVCQFWLFRDGVNDSCKLQSFYNCRWNVRTVVSHAIVLNQISLLGLNNFCYL